MGLSCENSFCSLTLRVWPILLGCIAVGGCSDGRPQLVPVSGRVLIDGKPLAFGFVRVAPADARSASGKIEPDGRFTLKTFEDGDGVITGVHPVAIIASEYINESEMHWHAPEEYSRTETARKSVQIDGPTDSLVIELTWDGDRPYRTRDGVRVRQ